MPFVVPDERGCCERSCDRRGSSRTGRSGTLPLPPGLRQREAEGEEKLCGWACPLCRIEGSPVGVAKRLPRIASDTIEAREIERERC